MIDKEMPDEEKIRAYNNLRKILGHVESGQGSAVYIRQDPITKEWAVKCVNIMRTRSYYGITLWETLSAAAQGEKHDQ